MVQPGGGGQQQSVQVEINDEWCLPGVRNSLKAAPWKFLGLRV